MPPRRSTPKGYNLARSLRKELTPAEQRLWLRLRGHQLGVNFRRQHALGAYIVDFCAIKSRLIIELDGSPHREQQEYDAERTKFLETQGYRVIRFWNDEVMTELDRVISVICSELSVP